MGLYTTVPAVYVPCLIEMCHDSFMCAMTHLCVPWLLEVCDMHSAVDRSFYDCSSRFQGVYMCHTYTHAHVCHFIGDTTHSFVWHDNYLNKSRRIWMRSYTHTHTHTHTYIYSCICVSFIGDTTYSFVWHDNHLNKSRQIWMIESYHTALSDITKVWHIWNTYASYHTHESCHTYELCHADESCHTWVVSHIYTYTANKWHHTCMTYV